MKTDPRDPERVARETLEALASIDARRHPLEDADPIHALADRSVALAAENRALRATIQGDPAAVDLARAGGETYDEAGVECASGSACHRIVAAFAVLGALAIGLVLAAACAGALVEVVR